MALATQFVDRVGATPGTNLSRQYLGALTVADSCVKSGGLTSFAGAVLTFGAMVVVINPADGTPAQEVSKAGGTYTVTGGTNTDTYVFLSTTGAYSQTSVTHGSGAPAVPSGTICLLYATIGASAGTITATTNVAPTAAQLLATSVAAHAPAAIPGFSWTAAKSVGDQIAALGTAVTAISGGTGGEIAGTDFKATGLPGATAGARLGGGTATGKPTSGAWQVGDSVTAHDGSLWLCTGAGTPGTWIELRGNPYTTTPTISGVLAGWTYNAGLSRLKPLAGSLNFTMGAAIAPGAVQSICAVNIGGLGLSGTPAVQLGVLASPLLPFLGAIAAGSFTIDVVNPTAAALGGSGTIVFYYHIDPLD